LGLIANSTISLDLIAPPSHFENLFEGPVSFVCVDFFPKREFLVPSILKPREKRKIANERIGQIEGFAGFANMCLGSFLSPSCHL
jgi:hypothetical protein